MRVGVIIMVGNVMKAENLKLEELVKFDEGLVSLHGRRLIIYDLSALGQSRRDLIEMVGPEQARRISVRRGFFWGQSDASSMNHIFQWDNTLEWIKAAPMLQRLQGIVNNEIITLSLDEAAGHFRMESIWHDSAEVQHRLAELGTFKEPSCWVMVGYASGYASYCLGKRVYFIEKKCRAKGDQFCLVEGRDIDSWGEEIKPHLPYFYADDIQGKIRKLTEQIQEKELELARERKSKEEALRVVSLSSVEVRSRRFQQVLDMANRVARFDSSVLITGGTGVGKEVLARHMHNVSPRAKASFVAVNCAALPETLLESELFGHKAGAFTGASKDRLGIFEEAQSGTIFLDEIGDITLAIQVKLLRVLQEREIMRVGESRPRKVDVRVMAATNRNLEQKANDGSFREDLFYRLSVIHIAVPSLHEHYEDILPLARHFVQKCAIRLGLPNLKLDATCIDFLLKHPWPGNIRELENAIEHAAVLCTDQLILPENLPSTVFKTRSHGGAYDNPHRSLDEVELNHIRQVLNLTRGNRAKAAKILKIGQATLYRKIGLLKQQGKLDVP